MTIIGVALLTLTTLGAMAFGWWGALAGLVIVGAIVFLTA